MTVNAVAVDAQDNVYVAGSGDAPDVPGLDRGFKARPDGVDAFVAKLDRSGNPIWATYIGGTDRRVIVAGGRFVATLSDSARAVAVDASGQVWVAGVTGADNFPVVGAFQNVRQGDTDGFVAKISADGRRLMYSTYVGARDATSSISGIAAGAAGEVWLQAESASQQWAVSHDVSGGTGRVIVMKLNPSGMPVWSTRVGLGVGGGFAVDGAGRPYLAGATCATFGGNCQQAVLRLDTSGSHIQFATTFPNTYAYQHRSQLALTPDGRAVFTGVILGEHVLPVRNAWSGPPRCIASPCGDGFVGVVGPSGELETLSYLGVGENAPVVTTDIFGRITIGSHHNANDLPVSHPLIDHHVDGPVYMSRDRGTTWRVPGRETLPPRGTADLIFNRGRSGIHLVAGSLHESRDQGATWQLESEGGITASITAWYRIAVDPAQPSIRYGIFGDHVLRHDEGSAQWRLVSLSASGTYRRTVVVSPHDSSVWIAGNAGVATSADGGQTWVARNSGLPNLGGSSSTVEDLHFHPRQSGVVYAATQVGLYVTMDNGTSWQHLTSALAPAPYVRGVAFDPVRRDVMYAATLNYGLLRSGDAGRTWVRKLETSRITVVATDHMKRHVVYASGSDADRRTVFYRSIDWGETWHDASAGLNMRFEPSRLLVDPSDSSRLYLASSGHSSVPYLVRLTRSTANPRSYVPEFASYLGAGTIKALTTTASGGLVAALAHAWPVNTIDQQIVTVRISQ